MKLKTEIDGIPVMVDYSIEGDVKSYAIINSIHDTQDNWVEYHSEYDLEFQCEHAYIDWYSDRYLKTGEI